MIDRDKLVEDLGQVFEFLKQIDDPYRDSVALAAGIISGEISEEPGAARLLRLEEVRGCKGFLWLQLGNKAVRAVVDEDVDGAVWFYVMPDNQTRALDMIYYGAAWRCWESRPSEEEMAGAPWYEEVDGDG